MNRKRFLAGSAVVAGGAAVPVAVWGLSGSEKSPSEPEQALPARPIPIPADGSIRTAVAIGHGVNVIDTGGPWEVFCDTAIYGGRGQFDLYTVASSTDAVEGNSGLEITPRYTYDNAPQPHVVVIPAHDESPATIEWLRHSIRLVRGKRFVEHERVATAGGLTSGIDLALRVVERYLGHAGARATTRYLEYSGHLS